MRTLGGFDPAYELFTDIKGQAAIALLEELHARDRFEERPLIWKGVVLARNGDHEEARRALQAAIAIGSIRR